MINLNVIVAEVHIGGVDYSRRLPKSTATCLMYLFTFNTLTIYSFSSRCRDIAVLCNEVSNRFTVRCKNARVTL